MNFLKNRSDYLWPKLLEKLLQLCGQLLNSLQGNSWECVGVYITQDGHKIYRIT